MTFFTATNAAQLVSDIAQANTNSAASNTIDLAAGDFQVENLTISNQNGARGGSTPTETLTIVGASENSTFLDGANLGRVLKIVTTDGLGLKVVLKNLTIENGKVVGGVGGTAQGGGMFVDGAK